MIRIPSLTFEEAERADFICRVLEERGYRPERYGNNIIVRHRRGGARPVLMLNAHIDTVQPAESYTFNPFDAPADSEAIFGLGSNDDGGSVTSLMHTFFYLKENDIDIPVDLDLVLTAEEERSGKNGMKSITSLLEKEVSFAIIGEPTQMKAAVAERGLLVIDATASGVSGHAARDEGVNAIYKAMQDIETIRNFQFEKESELMGKIRMTVTQINGGKQHNVIPDSCSFVIDIRPTEIYSNAEIVEMLESRIQSALLPRSLTNKTSSTPVESPLMRTIDALGIEKFISPTTSDWMTTPIDAVKMGPGSSARSHHADEFILKSEIEDAIRKYISFIENIRL